MDSLPAPAQEILKNAATVVELKVREPLIEAGRVPAFAYFPVRGVISNVLTMAAGDVVEVGVVGREGFAGSTLCLAGGKSSSTFYTQIAGSALKVTPDDLRAATVAGGERSFAAYVEAQIGSLSQYAACNRLHTTDERFARWLLMAHDRVQGNEIPLTQEYLALMLGVRRPGVSVAAAALQRQGAIEYRRGLIVVVDRTILLDAACECYGVVEDRFADLLHYSIRK